MPHIGSELVDWENLQVVHDWIKELTLDDEDLWNLRLQAKLNANITAVDPSNAVNDGTALDITLADTRSALNLQWLLAMRPGEVSAEHRPQIIKAGATHPNPIIRDLFEQFIPQSERVERLGNSVNAADILAMPGSVDRGRDLFLNSKLLQCKNCHQIGDEGKPLGPNLTKIARDRTKQQLLESILEPSKTIEPKYVTHIIETKSGLLHTGLLKERTEEKVVLLTAENKPVEIATGEIEQIVHQQKSLMPDLLFRDMTAEELADLLAFLESLK
jgi:putative heme-binding domain-containing protein